MKITSRFSVAVHTLLLIYFFENSRNVTSNFIASSVNTNPVVIRRILSNLKAAGFINVKGKTGSRLIKDPKDITLLDVFKAVDSVGDLFNFHENPNPECPVGKNIHSALDKHMKKAQQALENSLAKVTLEDLIKDIDEKENLL